MIDPSISLAVKTPQIESPVDQYSKLISLRSMMTENALHQQQIQQSQQQTEDLAAQTRQRNRELADRKTFQDAQLANGGDWDKSLAQTVGKIDPITYQTLSKARDESVKALLDRNKEQNAQDSTNYSKLDDALTGIKSLPEDQRAVEYKNVLARMGSDPQLGPLLQKGTQVGLVPTEYDPQAIDRVHAAVVGQKGLLAEAKEKQETLTSAAQAGKDTQQTTNLAHELPGVDATAAEKVSHLPVVKAIDKSTLNNPGLLTPEQEQQRKNAERSAITASGRLSVEQGRLALEKAKQNAEIGPETAQTWVDVLKKNPDAVKEVPQLVKNKVATMFAQQTGLPMPTAASSASNATEIAARNALDGGEFIKKAIANPEIQKRLGPILGRLGSVEQNLGTATAGLSPEAAKLAQELRTRMRYFVFQEGKSVLGGRLPQNLMNQLETSSANVHMDEPTLRGAVDGALGAAKTSMDNVDRERFGGQMRSREDRGLPSEMETKTYQGHTYQRKAGSSDPWTRQ